jgi:hypothetical protein
MTENTKRNYTEVGLVWPNQDRPGFTGVVSAACSLILTPGQQTLLVTPHPRVQGAHQVSVMMDAPKRRNN